MSIGLVFWETTQNNGLCNLLQHPIPACHPMHYLTHSFFSVPAHSGCVLNHLQNTLQLFTWATPEGPPKQLLRTKAQTQGNTKNLTTGF